VLRGSGLILGADTSFFGSDRCWRVPSGWHGICGRRPRGHHRHGGASPAAAAKEQGV